MCKEREVVWHEILVVPGGLLRGIGFGFGIVVSPVGPVGGGGDSGGWRVEHIWHHSFCGR